MPRLEFILPGDLQTATGGYVYDRRLLEGLRALGWDVSVHSLDESFPFPTSTALEQAAAVLAALPDHALVMIDGLALGAMPEVVEPHARRLRLVGLIHHPLAAETGLTPEAVRTLKQSEQRALQSVRRVIVTSRMTKDAVSAYGVSSERIVVVEPGTDAAPLARGSRDGVLELLCVATLTPRKGHAVLIEALAPLVQYKWHLTLVGSTARSPETVESLKAQIDRTELKERVTIAGEARGAELAAFFDAADLFVLPTLYEGYGMVVAEALACGLPVISTTTGAIAEIVPPEAGILVPPGDVSALRRALESVLSNARRLAELAEGARCVRPTLRRWPEAAARMASTLEEAAAA